MAFKDLSEIEVVEILSHFFSPSQEILEPERLIGREKYLKQISRAMHSPGRHVFIYGERGVGKTSLARTSGNLVATDAKSIIYVPCGEDTTFYEVFQAIGRSVLTPEEAVGTARSTSVGANLPGLVGASFSSNRDIGDMLPSSLNECFDILRFVKEQYPHQLVIVVDEIDRIKSTEERRRFAEIVKNIGSVVPDVRLILCGIGANIDEIIGEHLSTGRMFEPVEVERLNYSHLWKIIQDAAEALDVSIDEGLLIRTAKISDGFPHYVHLIGECLFYAMLDDPETVASCSKMHFSEALRAALQKTEPSIRKIYQIATEKTHAKLEYEEALWSLADKTADRRQIQDIYSNSYLRIKQAHDLILPKVRDDEGQLEVRSTLSRERLNQRLLALKRDNHANILTGYGSGWFSFRENVVRGYARLKAETVGIELEPEILS